MFGGTETVASAIEWAMAELMRSPEDLKKVQQELDNVVGPARKVEEPDFDKLTYLRCCLKEVLRLHPPIPSSSTRPPPTPSSPATTSPLNPASSSTRGPSAATRARGKTPTPSDRRGFSARERRISREQLRVHSVRVGPAVVPRDAAGAVRAGSGGGSSPPLFYVGVA
ncbi:UNVERIFIED_CONTAM: cytochrome [Sesamum calycinum]|uniref:Cytochrome n=1 Tax=Sesamum calycinum TaxID=2727403 RepID=A0AAW2MQE5_9LAMI